MTATSTTATTSERFWNFKVLLFVMGCGFQVLHNRLDGTEAWQLVLTVLALVVGTIAVFECLLLSEEDTKGIFRDWLCFQQPRGHNNSKNMHHSGSPSSSLPSSSSSRVFNGFIETSQRPVMRTDASLETRAPSSPPRRLPLLTSQHIDPLAMRRWKDVMTWITFSPQELDWVDHRQQSTLHHACLFSSPVDVIEMMVWMAPELTRHANSEGEIPLHWAIRLALSNPILHCMLRPYPSIGVMARDQLGNTPLSLLWERHEEDCMEYLKEAQSNSSEQESTQTETLKRLLLSNHGWKRILYLMQCHYDHCISHIDNDHQEGDKRQWKQDGKNIGTKEEQLPLHAAALCPSLPSGLFALLLQVYRQDVTRTDPRNGKTPLAVLCSQTSFFHRNGQQPEEDDEEDHDSLDPDSHDEDDDDDDGKDDTYRKLQQLLAVDTSAARIPDHSGRVPFWMALASGMTWDHGIQTLWVLNAKSHTLTAPSTEPTNVPTTTTTTCMNTGSGRSWLSQRDPVTGLYPFLLAAAATSNDITKLQSRPSSVDGVATCPCSYCCNNNNTNDDNYMDAPTMTEYENEAVTTSRSRKDDLDSLTTIYKLLMADPTQAYKQSVTN